MAAISACSDDMDDFIYKQERVDYIDYKFCDCEIQQKEVVKDFKVLSEDGNLSFGWLDDSLAKVGDGSLWLARGLGWSLSDVFEFQQVGDWKPDFEELFGQRVDYMRDWRT